METAIRHVRIPGSRWDQAGAKAAALGTDRGKLINALLALALSGTLDGLLPGALDGLRAGGGARPGQGRPPGQDPAG